MENWLTANSNVIFKCMAFVIFIFIVILHSLFSLVVRKIDWAKKLFTNKPMLLIYTGQILKNNLNKTNVGMNDFVAKLGKANVFRYEDVEARIVESTGDMSVLHGSNGRIVAVEVLQYVASMPTKE